MKKHPVYLPCMLAASTCIPFTEIKQELRLAVQGQYQHWRKNFSLLCLVSLYQPPTVCRFSHFSCYLQETFLWLGLCYLQGTSWDTFLCIGLSLIDSSTANGPLMWNCFIDFAVEYRFGCLTTEIFALYKFNWLIDLSVITALAISSQLWKKYKEWHDTTDINI